MKTVCIAVESASGGCRAKLYFRHGCVVADFTEMEDRRSSREETYFADEAGSWAFASFRFLTHLTGLGRPAEEYKAVEAVMRILSETGG